MSDIYYSNFQLKENTEYFIYIGELKNYGLNLFLREALSKIFKRRVDFVAVVPDVFEQYNYDNLLVINPLAKQYASKYGANVSCRISARDFMACVSQNRKVKALIAQLLRRQEHVYLYMYESLPEMTLDAIDGVSILGPDSRIAHRLNSKAYQLEHLKGRVPTVDFHICRGRRRLLETAARVLPDWKDGVFVSREYGAAGVNSMIAHTLSEISERFPQADETYFVSRYLPHDHDPTVLAVAAGKDEVYIAGIADQKIEGGNRFTGSFYPSVLDESTREALRAHTRTLGSWLAGEGYRGIFGCDYLVDPQGRIFFLEINARKQGTTLEFCCTLEQSLPPGSPMLPELEFYAVTRGKFPETTVELRGNPKKLHWGTYNYKIASPVRTVSYVPHSPREREAFERVGKGLLKKHFLILEHTGSDFIVAEGAFLGRIVALGRDPFSVRQGLEQGRKTIELTIVKDKELEEIHGKDHQGKKSAG